MDMKLVGRWHRVFLGVFVLYGLFAIATAIFPNFAAEPVGEMTSSFLAAITGLVSYRLLNALQTKNAMFWAIASAIPFLGVIALFKISSIANNAIKDTGQEVSIFGGPKKSK